MRTYLVQFSGTEKQTGEVVTGYLSGWANCDGFLEKDSDSKEQLLETLLYSDAYFKKISAAKKAIQTAKKTTFKNDPSDRVSKYENVKFDIIEVTLKLEL